MKKVFAFIITVLVLAFSTTTFAWWEPCRRYPMRYPMPVYTGFRAGYSPTMTILGATIGGAVGGRDGAGIGAGIGFVLDALAAEGRAREAYRAAQAPREACSWYYDSQGRAYWSCQGSQFRTVPSGPPVIPPPPPAVPASANY
jgi:hypothetical protein